jgi:hypothetical protein
MLDPVVPDGKAALETDAPVFKVPGSQVHFALGDKIQDQQERAHFLAGKLRPEHRSVRLMDGHGRFLLLFLDEIVSLHGAGRLRDLRIDLVDIDGDVNSWHKMLFGSCKQIRCICGDIFAQPPPTKADLVYLNFCGASEFRAEIREFFEQYPCLLSFYVSRGARSSMADTIAVLKGRGVVRSQRIDSRPDFNTFWVEPVAAAAAADTDSGDDEKPPRKPKPAVHDTPARPERRDDAAVPEHLHRAAPAMCHCRTKEGKACSKSASGGRTYTCESHREYETECARVFAPAAVAPARRIDFAARLDRAPPPQRTRPLIPEHLHAAAPGMCHGRTKVGKTCSKSANGDRTYTCESHREYETECARVFG